jgi:hypothetical protein
MPLGLITHLIFTIYERRAGEAMIIHYFHKTSQSLVQGYIFMIKGQKSIYIQSSTNAKNKQTVKYMVFIKV